MRRVCLALQTATLLLLGPGCRKGMQFMVVDSASGLPIAGATVRVTQVNYHFLFRRETQEQDLGQRDANGIISIAPIRGQDLIDFAASGFYGARAGFVENGRIGNPPEAFPYLTI